MKTTKLSCLSALLALSFASLSTSAIAAAQERTGKQVVETVCAKCHESGKDGAPRLNDREEWAKRASGGLEKLSDNAISGIRKMPAHGNQASLTDLEVSRAIAYMVSGGMSVDPKRPYSSPVRVSGKQLVETRCVECHGSGKNGAPKIGDKAAWEPRLKKGLDELLRSAITGHNSMPARAGMASLSDSEVKAAMQHMVVLTETAK